MDDRNLYIFSGLGADERIFQLLDLSGFSASFIKWEVPEDGESIEHYATRLLSQIKGPKPILMGLSFGGLISVEIAKQIETDKVILIASAKTKDEIPAYYRLAGKLKLYKLLSAHRMKKSNRLAYILFGASTTFERQLLQSIFERTNPVFLKWAIEKVFTWSNQTVPDNIWHIHGTKDHILPFRYVHCDIVINNGGHFLTLNRADEVSKQLKTIIS